MSIRSIKQQLNDCSSIAINSRRVKPGGAFLAYSGANADGRDYIAEAIDRGASMIVYDPIDYQVQPTQVTMLALPDLRHQAVDLIADFYHLPGNNLTIIGVTGTNGKTSVCQFVAQALTQCGLTCGVLSTVGNGVFPNLVQAATTTPDPVSIQAFLAECVQHNIMTVVMEVSSHALDQNRVRLADFDIAVFTNLSQDHLDYHGTMQAYAQAKAKLFSAPNLKHAVINAVDPYKDIMCASVRSGVTLYEYTADAALPPQLWGEFNRFNCAAVRQVLSALAISAELIDDAITQLKPVTGRMEWFDVSQYLADDQHQYPHIVIDFAHTPDALEQVLVTLKHQHKPIWIIFGCGGDRDQSKRALMGAIAEQHADHVVLTSDNPRFEQPESIIDDIKAGMVDATQASTYIDRHAAIRYALSHAGCDAIVLLAGKGHEQYQVVRDKQISFDERTIIADIVREMQ